MKKLIFLLLVVVIGLPATLSAYDSTCGNTGKKKCKGGGGGANPIDFERADVHRTVVDLETFGNAPFQFSRNIHSRTTDFNDPYWELGARQTWQHNWNYEVRDLGPSTFGHLDVKVRYPDGADYNFRATDSTGMVRVPDADNGDKLYKWTGTPVGHTLVTSAGWEYDFKRTTSLRYRLEKVRNGQGLSWTPSYDSSNQLIKVQNDFGRYIEIERQTNSQGVVQISKIRSSDGREVSYGYSSWIDGAATNSVLTSVTYPDGTQALYNYVGALSLTNGRPLLATASDPMFTPRMGARIKYVFNYNAFFDFGAGPTFVTGIVKEERNLDTDAVVVNLPLGSGEYPQILEGDGTEITRIYNSSGQLIEERDGEGRPTYFAYDQGGAGFLTNRTDAAGASTTYVHDEAGRVIQEINALGFTNSVAYSAAGFVITNTDALARSTIYTRNTNNLPTRVDYPDGSFETFVYNQYGQVLTNRLRNGGTVINSYNATGLPISHKDAEGAETIYTYDSVGRFASVTDARSNITSFAYDWRGQVLATTNADNTVVTFQYDSFGNRTNVLDELGHAAGFTYDEYARPKTVRDPLGRVTSYEYGRLPISGGGCSSCAGPANTVTKITDPAGKITEYAYDRSDKRTNETAAAGTPDASATTWTYDAVGRLKTQIDANGHNYTWVYDALGRVVAETNALNQATTYGYDPVGNRTNRVDGAEVVSFWTYNDMNRITATGSGTLSYEYGYDDGGRRTTMKTTVNGTITETTTYTYDARDLLLSKADPTGFTLGYGYDAVGNRTNLTVDSVLSQSYVYDSRNRLTNMLANGKSTGFSYDASGRRAGVSFPNGISAGYGYDEANQLTSLHYHRPFTSHFIEFDYEYDDAGNRTNMTTLEGVNSYKYNENNWLISATYPDSRSQGFFYNAVGNRTNLTDSGAGVSPVAYSYDNANRLLSSTAPGETNSYTYDGAGRLIAQTLNAQSRSYAYSFRSQLSALTDTNGANFAYEFDGDGNRLKQSGSGCLSARYVYDGPNVVLELNASNQVVRAYVNGPGIDQPIERIDFLAGTARSRYVYHTDGLGSVVALTDYTHAPLGPHVVKSYAYEVFGKIRSEGGTVIDRYTFTAREALGDSLGLYYYRWRMMDPSTGRFITEDRLGFVDGPNLYLYVRNNPIRRRDARGLQGGGGFPNAPPPEPLNSYLINIGQQGRIANDPHPEFYPSLTTHTEMDPFTGFQEDVFVIPWGQTDPQSGLPSGVSLSDILDAPSGAIITDNACYPPGTELIGTPRSKYYVVP